ncbi:2-hydroxychromene-2-carboxylate isomerase [Emcibacter sp.]|uniref:2-hydroxychromene-2-carboxylate isomerase n=1 Tax=Emcibacter sp. TaxID=1979954 RepID=UPI002AA6FA96|nr:2-hydroxychromene-2-carboxylate isomerase [Emcibacter sp.]
MKTIDFYFDIYSPYAYLAFHRLTEIADKYNCAVNYLPIDLKRAKVAAGNTGPANMQIPPKIRYLMTDLKRWATRYNLPFGAIPKNMDSSRLNRGVFYAIERDDARDYVRESYDAVWGHGGDMTSDELLSDIARKLNWDPEEFLAYIGSGDADEKYENLFNDAVERGVFGVPVVIIDDQMWWGNDRLHFVEEYLAEKARYSTRLQRPANF